MTLFDPGPPVCPTCKGAKSVWSDDAGAPIRCPTCNPAPPSDFNKVASEAAAERGMDAAARALRVQEWKDDANRWFRNLPSGSILTSDMLIAAVGVADEGANRNNVLGAWFSGKAKTGKIVFTGRLVKSERVSRHVGLQREWRKI